MSNFSYETQGTCSKRINLTIEDDVIVTCSFDNGCGGNLQGIGTLVTGRKVDEVIDLLNGIQCRNGTSCPDQLAKALREYQQTR